MAESLNDALNNYIDQENLHRNEGSTGVKNLCRVLNAMGYQDKQYFGQFHQRGSFGDLICFLEDNPGAIEAIYSWIGEMDNSEWQENLEEQTDESEDEEEDEE